MRRVEWAAKNLEFLEFITRGIEENRVTNPHLLVCEVEGKLVAACVCVIIPNLTRNVRPYAFVENVVTHGDYRKRGYATACLNFAKQIAKENNCYKMMLLTGSKEERT